MLGVLTNRTGVTTAALLRAAQLDAGANHEQHSVAELFPLWSNASCAINILLLKTKIKQRVPGLPSRNCSFKLEITFCVRGVVSPLLANLLLHYAMDAWMRREMRSVRFCRYADDGVVHCKSEMQARLGLRKLGKRLRECGLELHPEKTRIVYCQDINRQAAYPTTQFTFLGYTFRPRKAVDKYKRVYVNFSPAVSREALKDMRQTVRGWHLQLMCNKELSDLSNLFNPVLRGWTNYYGRFYPKAMKPLWRQVNAYLVRWMQRKYKQRARGATRAVRALGRLAASAPRLFVHWEQGIIPAAR
jgi:RNA-directed DNA polymerase